MMEMNIFGYHIAPDVLINISSKKIINTSEIGGRQWHKEVILRDTMFRLLTYLLENAQGRVISNEEYRSL